MSEVVGVVKKITEKATRNGGTMYNACLDTGGRDDEWFGHGFDEPVFGEGDEIGFNIKMNGEYENIDVDSVEILKEAPPKRGGRGQHSGRSGGGQRGGNSRGSSRGKPAAKGKSSDDKMTKEEWAQKDKMIQLQSAMNTSIALVSAAVQCDAVQLPAKKAEKYEAFCALVDEEAERLHKQYREQVYGAAKEERTTRTTRGRSARSNDDYDDDIPQ